MAGISSISLPHATIPTQMFGNVNLQNAVMYVNDNFKALLDGTNANATATNDALKGKSDATHTHDEAYAAIGHVHQWQDIQGLSAMLDGKSELNHEHAQYLSSLPAHFHDVNSVNGLTDIIKGKADANHRHNVGDIDELATELGNKASAAYVDQQVANIGSSIQPIVEDVVETKGFAKVAPNTYGQGQEYTTEAALAATHPKDIEPIPDPDSAKTQREISDIGTSAKAARADHRHRMVFSTSIPSEVGGVAAGPGSGIYPARFDHAHPLSTVVATWYRSEKTTSNLVSIEAGGIVDSGQPKPEQGFRFVQGAINGIVEGYLVEGGAANTDGIRNSGIKTDDVLVNDESDPYVKQSDVEETAGSIADEKITTFSGTLPNLYAAKSTEATVATNTANITTNTNGISALDVRVTALENQPPSGGGTVKSVDGIQPTSNGNVALGALTYNDVGNTVQPYNAALKTLAENLTDAGKVPFASIDGSISGHGGNCLMYVNGSGVVGHVGDGSGGNDIYDLVSTVNTDGTKIITDDDIGNGLTADESGNILVQCKANGGIGVDGDGIYLGGLSGTGFVKSENGALSIPTDQPITASGDGFLKKSGIVVTGTTIAIGDVTDLQTALDGKAASVHTHTIANVDGLQDALDEKVDDTDLGDAAYGTIGEDVQAYNANLTSLTGHLDGNGRVSLETGVYSTTGTTGIVGVENGAIDVRDAIGTDLVSYDGTNTLDDVIGTDGMVAASHVKLGNGLEASSSDAIQVKCKDGGGVSATSDGLEISGAATYDTDNPPTSPSIVSMDADGFLTDECALPTTAPSSNKVLTCKSGGTALSWEDGMTVGTQLAPSPQSGANIPVDSAGDTFLNPSGFTPPTQTTWTRGGETPTGVMITVCTGVKKHNGSSAYRSAVFSNLYFDENGCLCKIETAKNWYRVQ